MKFRDHPALKDKGFPSWPPIWVEIERKTYQVVRGEVGVLADVRSRESALFLTIRHEGRASSF